ncbi:hypothetical protein HNQ56_002710 [Anaerotaenia torta]|uniref:carbohydrate-binding domain-containing protein n=1 Tax=Anaerotaenia torta TaxID=433293 RepID=UPI003D24648D
MNQNTQQNTQTGGTQDQKGTTEAPVTAADSVTAVEVNKEFTARDLEVGYEESSAAQIELNGSSITVTGTGASVKDQTVTISRDGSYVITGSLDNGQIIVDAGDLDKIQLILNGAAIHSASNAPIYIKNADKVFITLQEGTDNSLSDGTEYVQTDDNNVDGVIFSKADLTLNGSGSLTIQANYKQGIVSKDDLVFTGGSYNITAVKDTINGKDCIKIKDGSFTLSADTGNGLQSKNSDDPTRGYVYICGGTIDITKSQEGIEGTVIIIEDGAIVINAADDGLNAASASADTTEGDTTTSLSADTREQFPASTAESTSDKISGNLPGTKSGDASDSTSGNVPGTDSGNAFNNPSGNPPDGSKIPWNGTEPSGEIPATGEGDMNQWPSGMGQSGDSVPSDWTPPENMGRGGFGGENPFESDDNCYISISGGTLTINAEGDGIDSNGNLYISGGTIYVNGPTQSMNGSLDYGGVGEITGGILIAAGSAGMSQGFTESSSQCSLLYDLSSANAAGTQIILTDSSGKSILKFIPEKQYQSVVLSSPEMVQGETYTLTCGTQTAEITLSSIVTSNGQGRGWGMGQRGGRR